MRQHDEAHLATPTKKALHQFGVRLPKPSHGALDSPVHAEQHSCTHVLAVGQQLCRSQHQAKDDEEGGAFLRGNSAALLAQARTHL